MLENNYNISLVRRNLEAINIISGIGENRFACLEYDARGNGTWQACNPYVNREIIKYVKSLLRGSNSVKRTVEIWHNDGSPDGTTYNYELTQWHSYGKKEPRKVVFEGNIEDLKAEKAVVEETVTPKLGWQYLVDDKWVFYLPDLQDKIDDYLQSYSISSQMHPPQNPSPIRFQRDGKDFYIQAYDHQRVIEVPASG